MLNKMTNLEDLKRHFKVLYPNCTVKLYEKFQQFLEDNHSSLPKVLETNFLTFITKIMRVNLSQSMSFSDSLEKLLESKEKINHKVDDKKLIPGFITKNILTMPSNRGYIWKNKKYHGKKNPVEGPEVLFEPRKGKTFIHVYEKMHHKIYQKMKGEKVQTLVNTEYVQQEVQPYTIPVTSKREIEAQPYTIPKTSKRVAVAATVEVEKVAVRGNSYQLLNYSSDSDNE
jgi:hypothetical protein